MPRQRNLFSFWPFLLLQIIYLITFYISLSLRMAYSIPNAPGFSSPLSSLSLCSTPLASSLPYLVGFFSIFLTLLANGHCFCYSLLPRIYSFLLFSVSKFSLISSAWLKDLLPPFNLLQQFLKRALFLHSKSLYFLVAEVPLTLIEPSLTSTYSDHKRLWSAIEH